MHKYSPESPLLAALSTYEQHGTTDKLYLQSQRRVCRNTCKALATSLISTKTNKIPLKEIDFKQFYFSELTNVRSLQKFKKVATNLESSEIG